MSVMDEMANFFSGVTDSYVKIEKELERAIVKGVFSSVKQWERSNMERSKDVDIKLESGVTKQSQSIRSIGGELDSAMKGTYSKKVISTIEDEAKKYDKLS